jgi:hypothetical protein
MANQRAKRPSVFGSDRKEELGDLVDNLPIGSRAGQSAPPLREVPPLEVPSRPASPAITPAPPAPLIVDVGNVAALPARHSSSTEVNPAASRPPRAKRVTRRRGRSIRPPEASIAYAVYTRLLEVSADEKHQKGLAARPYGVIVMDALDRHASTLEKRWTETPAESAPSNSLFVRSDTALLRRKRTGSKKTIPLSGISAENRRLLDRYAQEWNAGGRSALVEEALRLEFGMPSSDYAAEDSGS